MTQQAMKLENNQQNNVPLRQFSLYRPPYEDLYTFWWKCMQITLHDKGTQTANIGDKSPDESLHQETNEPKSAENDQLKQLMAMVNHYNSVGRERTSKSTKTFRGASALAPGFSPSMLSNIADPQTQSSDGSTAMETTTPVMEQRPVFSPTSLGSTTSSTGTPGTPKTTSSTLTDFVTPSSSTPGGLLCTPSLTSSSTASSPGEALLSPAGIASSLLSPELKTESKDTKDNNFTATSIFGDPGTNAALSATLSAALLSQPLFSQAMSQLTNSITNTNISSSQTLTTSSTPGVDASPSSPVKSSPSSSPLLQGRDKASPGGIGSPRITENLHFSDGADQLSDLIHIKQLTDVLGRKAVLDSLSPSISSSGADLSQYLGSSMSMAQAASLLGQLPTSTSSRNLLGSLCSMPLYNMEQALKTEGYGSLDNRSHGKTERSRHYQAAEQDTSNITLPEGFESEDHLTWSEVEGFVNEFKTKRVKLGYTQAHVGAALALVHGPEFSQTTISRFEGLQLSFPNHKKIIPILRRWLESVENPAKRRHHSPSILHGSSQNGNSKRRKRTTISSNSKEVLEQYYQTNPLPSTEEIGNLSNNLTLDKRVIRIWFQNRRAIGKRLSKLIVTMGGGASRNQMQSSPPSIPISTMSQHQGLF
ncbi:hypothetical protein ACHWQZ_G001467 [Mnemiopsis leidyi]